MTNFKKTLIQSAAAAALALLATAGAASAAPVINVISVYDNGTTTGAAPFALLNLGTGTANSFISSSSFSSGGENISFSGGSGETHGSGVYTGNNSGLYSSPFSNNNSTSKYLVAGAGTDTRFSGITGTGTVTITFDTPQTTLNLLWGSVDFNNDQNYVTINGFNIDGEDINNASSLIHSGDSGDDDVYVSISNVGTFSSVTFKDLSDDDAFEFLPGAPVATPVPEPLTMSLFGAGLAGAAAIRRRRKAAKA